MPNYIQHCPVCNAQMESMGAWPLYEVNGARQFNSTFVCNNCDKHHKPPSLITKTVWVYVRSDADVRSNAGVSG